MTDRIANPWGTRVPFGRDGEWPVRVDQFLEDGVDEGEVDAWIQTAFILHSNGDAMDVAVKDGRIVGVRGRGVDRVNKGRVDPKDRFGWQANNSGDRLMTPRVGAGALSVALTGAVLLLLNASHPPTGATTLIVSLGFLQAPPEMAALMVGVVPLMVGGWLLNRAAGVPMPVWGAKGGVGASG